MSISHPSRDPDDSVLRRTGTLIQYETSLNIWEEHVEEEALYRVLTSLVRHMRARGFESTVDREMRERHGFKFAKKYRVGSRRGLEFRIDLCGRHIEIQFFQNIVIDNPNGGRYDSGKFEKMGRASRVMQLECIVEMTLLLRALAAIGYRVEADASRGQGPARIDYLAVRDTANRSKMHADDPLAEFEASWGSHVRGHERDADGWPLKWVEAWCNKDRDGQPVARGETRYIRRYGTDSYKSGGRLMRVVVYPSSNGQWQVRFSGRCCYVSAGELFLCERPDLEPRRFVPGQAERLKREIEAGLKRNDYKRVAAMAAALARIPQVEQTKASAA